MAKNVGSSFSQQRKNEEKEKEIKKKTGHTIQFPELFMGSLESSYHSAWNDNSLT